jgi:hypothetical protein
MQTTFSSGVNSYLRAKQLSRGTRIEYFSTLRKWEEWGGSVPIEELRRRHIREFLDWVYERAVTDGGINPGRTANKAREYLRERRRVGGPCGSSGSKTDHGAEGGQEKASHGRSPGGVGLGRQYPITH